MYPYACSNLKAILTAMDRLQQASYHPHRQYKQLANPCPEPLAHR